MATWFMPLINLYLENTLRPPYLRTFFSAIAKDLKKNWNHNFPLYLDCRQMNQTILKNWLKIFEGKRQWSSAILLNKNSTNDFFVRLIQFQQCLTIQMTEPAICKCSSKQVFLKISQYSKENTCDGISFE